MKYAIWVETQKDRGFVELHSDGVVKFCRNAFEAKLMPTMEQAIILAKSILKFEELNWVEVVSVTYHVNGHKLVWDGEKLS